MNIVKSLQTLLALLKIKPILREQWVGGRAKATIQHHRLRSGCTPAYLADGTPDPAAYYLVDEEVSHNVITNAGRDFLHQQGYGTSGLGANGLNYIALSNDTLTETVASTTLSNEISGNGLQRAQGTVGHTANTNTTTVQKVFTATGAQSAQKAALFTASSLGIMNHALAFTQRNLISGDTLTIIFTITLG